MEKPLQNREGVSEEMADKRKPVLSPEQHLSSNMTLHHPGDDELRDRALEIINSDTDLHYLKGSWPFGRGSKPCITLCGVLCWARKSPVSGRANVILPGGVQRASKLGHGSLGHKRIEIFVKEEERNLKKTQTTIMKLEDSSAPFSSPTRS